MKLINNRLILTALLLFFSVFFFSACEEDSGANPQTVDNFESDEYAILDFNDALNSVQGGTMDEAFALTQPFPGDNNFQRGPNHPNRKGSHLRQILWLLELSDDQKELVREYVNESHECARSAFADFRSAVQPILRDANEQRLALIEEYRNGEITNEELYFALQELRSTTHETIENDPAVQGAKQLICDCKLNLLDNVGSLLTDNQLTIWNDWVSNMEGPCIE